MSKLYKDNICINNFFHMITDANCDSNLCYLILQFYLPIKHYHFLCQLCYK